MAYKRPSPTTVMSANNMLKLDGWYNTHQKVAVVASLEACSLVVEVLLVQEAAAPGLEPDQGLVLEDLEA